MIVLLRCAFTAGGPSSALPRTTDMKVVGEKTVMQNQGFNTKAPLCLRKLFSWLLSLTAMCVVLQCQTPPTSTVSDTVYRADGTPASGTLLISWPAFTTS